MSGHSLPKEYKGFSTAELVALWKSIPDRTLKDPPVSKEKISAMDDLLREYALLDFGKDGDDAEKIRRSKELLAPYGIDPAPWADENGVEQAELRRANSERLRQEEKARRERNKAIYQNRE